jgi:hypothetical protein
MKFPVTGCSRTSAQSSAALLAMTGRCLPVQVSEMELMAGSRNTGQTATAFTIMYFCRQDKSG